MWRKVLNSDKFFEYVWRWTLLVAGMFVAACGIAIITQTNLGTTPISSLPYAVTGLTGYSFGTTTFFINLIFIALQWVILSRKGVFHDVLSDSGRVRVQRLHRFHDEPLRRHHAGVLSAPPPDQLCREHGSRAWYRDAAAFPNNRAAGRRSGDRGVDSLPEAVRYREGV